MEKVLDIKLLNGKINSSKAVEFLKNISLATADGKYELDNGISANVVSYTTDAVDADIFEAHKHTIDIHYIVAGKEKILIGKNTDNPTELYDEQNDGCLYKTEKIGEVIYACGQAVIINPNELHMAGYAIETIKNVKKVILKIKNSNQN